MDLGAAGSEGQLRRCTLCEDLAHRREQPVCSRCGAPASPDSVGPYVPCASPNYLEHMGPAVTITKACRNVGCRNLFESTSRRREACPQCKAEEARMDA